MKLKIDLDGEYLVAFERALARSGLSNSPDWQRYLAVQLILMGSECFATTPLKPVVAPVGRFEFRYWDETEKAALRVLRAAEKPPTAET